jgi:hypothetical protein
MFRTLLIVALALALAGAAGASDWRTDEDSYESGVFLDMSSYKILPNGDRQIWILRAFQKPVASSGGPVDFQLDLVDFNCSARTQAAKYSVAYFMDGRSDAAASGASPNAAAERMSEVVCGDLSRLTAVPGEASFIAHRYRALGNMRLH